MEVSFFELVMQERLLARFKPAFKYLFTAAGRRVAVIGTASKFSEEVFYYLSYLLEGHFLSIYDASFSENFYGLKRVRLPSSVSAFTGAGGGQDLGPEIALDAVDRKRALATLVLAPYIRGKMEAWYTENIALLPFEQQNPDPSPLQRLRRLALRWYPYIDAVYEAVVFAYNVGFLCGGLTFYHPSLHFLRHHLRRLTLDDMKAHKERIASKKALRGEVNFEKIWNSSSLSTASRILEVLGQIRRRVNNFLTDNARWALVSVYLVFKFIEWWYSPTNQINAGKKLPVPPPPQTLPAVCAVPRDKSLCPICERPRTNPACTPSGYVYCYPCIHRAVEEGGVCPVTQMPCQVSQIRKVYDS